MGALGQDLINGVIPAITSFATQAIGQLIPGLVQLATWIGQIVSGVFPLFVQGWRLISENMNIVLPILAAVGAVILAITSPVTALAGAVVLLATAWANNWLGIQGIVSSVIATIQPYFTQLYTILSGFVTAILPPLQQAWQTLVQVWIAEVGPALAQLWLSLQQLFVTLGIGTGDTDLWSAAMGALKMILYLVVGAVQLLTPVIKFYADVLVFLIEQIKTTVDNLTKFKSGIDAIFGAVNNLIGKIKEMAAALIDLAIPDWLTPGSPTPFEMGLRGIASAIDGMPDFPGLTAPTGGGGGAAAGGGSGPATVGNISIVINGAGDPAAVGQEVQRQLASLFNQSATQAF